MKCPNELRECPHGWTDCSLCANLTLCQTETYVPEPEPGPIPATEPVDELEENELTTDLGVVVPQERGTWAERLSKMTEGERWAEYYRYHPDDLISKEPITCLSGPTAPGGGSKCRVPKKPKKQIPEYLKTFGQQL